MASMTTASIEDGFIAFDLEEIKVDGQHILRIFRYIQVLLGCLAGMKLLPLLQQLFFGLLVSGIRNAAIYRTYF